MESVIRGEATKIINYQTIVPELVYKDFIDTNVVDDQGNELSKSGVKSERATFTNKIDNDALYIMIYPEFSDPRGERVSLAAIKINLKKN